LDGCQTDVLKRAAQNSKDLNPKLCFSVVCKDRTLDLEVPTITEEKAKDEWADGLRSLMGSK